MFRVRVDRSFSHNGYNLWISKYDIQNRKTYVAKPIEILFEEIPEGSLWPSPSLRLESGPIGDGEILLRALAEGIMEAGLVPAMTPDNSKQVEAMKEHTKDLRHILDKLLSLEHKKIDRAAGS